MQIPYLEVHTTVPEQAGAGSENGEDTTAAHIQCCRYPLTIDFNELDWDQIIATKRFVFYYCSGECSSTMPVHSPRPTRRRKALPATELQCCVSRKTSRLSVLYINSSGCIHYRDFSDTIADECERQSTD